VEVLVSDFNYPHFAGRINEGHGAQLLRIDLPPKSTPADLLQLTRSHTTTQTAWRMMMTIRMPRLKTFITWVTWRLMLRMKLTMQMLNH
jgi:hypothetical protein